MRTSRNRRQPESALCGPWRDFPVTMLPNHYRAAFDGLLAALRALAGVCDLVASYCVHIARMWDAS